MLWKVVVVMLLFTPGSIGRVDAGWVIDQVSTGAPRSRQQVTIQANRMKTVDFEGDRPTVGILFDLDAEAMTQIDYAERSYTTVTLREYRELFQSVQTQMRAAMEGVPPEQRKMMEQMMRSQMPQAGAAGDCRPPRTEVKKTGQQRTIAGYAATRYEVFVDGARESEMWIAPAITVGRELNREKLARFVSEWGALTACGPQGGRGLRRSDPSWTALPEGYPVRLTDASGTTHEVVKAEQRTVPAGEFVPPAGFTRKSLPGPSGR
jgi:hypothetical protein